MQHAVCDVIRRDSSAIKFDRDEIAFTFGCVLLAGPLTDEVTNASCLTNV